MNELPLYRVLQRYGTTKRRLAPDTMYEATELLVALAGGTGILQDGTARLELSEWAVAQLERIIANIEDELEHRTAEVIFAIPRCFHECSLTERFAYLTRHNELGVVTNFKRVRHRVLTRIAIELHQANRARSAPWLMLSGRYVDADRQRPISRELAAMLARLPVNLICGGSILGADTMSELGSQLERRGIYAPDRLTMHIRRQSRRIPPDYRHYGTVLFTSDSRYATRRAMMRTAQACLVFAGGDFGDHDGNGTAKEVAIATELRLPIVPMAGTDGYAKHLWSPDRVPKNGTPELAQAWTNLTHRTPTVLVAAAERLIIHHFGLGSPDTDPTDPLRR